MTQPITVSLDKITIMTDDGEIRTLLDDASEKLADVVKAVMATNKAGSITIKIDMKPSTAGALAVRGDCKTKKPVGLPREALLWATPEGGLLGEDPKQQKLDLKMVSVQKTELKAVQA